MGNPNRFFPSSGGAEETLPDRQRFGLHAEATGSVPEGSIPHSAPAASEQVRNASCPSLSHSAFSKLVTSLEAHGCLPVNYLPVRRVFAAFCNRTIILSLLSLLNGTVSPCSSRRRGVGRRDRGPGSRVRCPGTHDVSGSAGNWIR